MRWNSKTDSNHVEVCDALRKAGLSVLSLHRVGEGAPDILVSSSTEMWLVEIKTDKGKLNDRQKRFHANWRGKPILVVKSAEEAIAAICRQSN